MEATARLELELPQHDRGGWPVLDTLISLDAETKTARCSRLYTGTEAWEATAHLKDFQIYPGIYLQEGMALTLSQLAQCLPELAGKTVRYTGCDGFRIRGVVRPGEQIIYTAKIDKIKVRRDIVFGHGSGQAEVNGKQVAFVSIIHFVTGDLDLTT